MTIKIDVYAVTGLIFFAFGANFAAYCYWVVHSVPMTALGLALVILGASIALLPTDPVPNEAVRGIIEVACANMEAMLEEYDAHERAWYLPPREGSIYCFVPLIAGVNPATVWAATNAPVKILTKSMGVKGLMMLSPGSKTISLAQLEGETRLEEAMAHVLVDYLGGAESVKAVREGNIVNVFIKKPRFTTNFSRFNAVFGSLLASVLGCVAAQVLKAPVKVIEERTERNSSMVKFEVLATG